MNDNSAKESRVDAQLASDACSESSPLVSTSELYLSQDIADTHLHAGH